MCGRSNEWSGRDEYSDRRRCRANGLAAAVALAWAGLRVTVLEAAARIGGGTRSGEAIVPGLLHDFCSAIHLMAVGSSFLSELGLDRYGLRWAWPEIDCVHPLDGGTAGVLHRSVTATAAGLGADGRTWRRLFEGLSAAGPCAGWGSARCRVSARSGPGSGRPSGTRRCAGGRSARSGRWRRPRGCRGA